MNSSFTNGPWRFEPATRTIRSVPANYWIATMDSWDGAVDNAANARLIAAAPELYAALHNLVARGLISTDGDHYDEAIEAINLATGQES